MKREMRGAIEQNALQMIAVVQYIELSINANTFMYGHIIYHNIHQQTCIINNRNVGRF